MIFNTGVALFHCLVVLEDRLPCRVEFRVALRTQQARAKGTINNYRTPWCDVLTIHMHPAVLFGCAFMRYTTWVCASRLCEMILTNLDLIFDETNGLGVLSVCIMCKYEGIITAKCCFTGSVFVLFSSVVLKVQVVVFAIRNTNNMDQNSQPAE